MMRSSLRAVFVVGSFLASIAGAEEQNPKIQDKPLSEWVAQLTDMNRGKQVRAARALSEAPEDVRAAITKRLIPLLRSDRENDRFVAAQVLGDYGPLARAAVPDLLLMLKGTQFERNRAAAAKALGQILKDAKPSKEIDEVAAALSAKYNEEYDNYSDVRREAVRAVGMIGPAAKSVIPKLTRALTDFKQWSQEHQMVRQQAAWACGRMGPLAAEHIDRLIAMMHTEGHELPEIVEAIGNIGAVHENVALNVVDWLEKLGRGGRYGAAKLAGWIALEKLGGKAEPVVPLIARYLREGLREDPPESYVQWFRILRAAGPKAEEILPKVREWAEVQAAPRGWAQEMFEKVRQEAAATAAKLEGK